jgi:hypothetical protein
MAACYLPRIGIAFVSGLPEVGPVSIFSQRAESLAINLRKRVCLVLEANADRSLSTSLGCLQVLAAIDVAQKVHTRGLAWLFGLTDMFVE